MRPVRNVLVVLLSVALMVGACGSDGDDETTAVQSTDDPAQTQPDEADDADESGETDVPEAQEPETPETPETIARFEVGPQLVDCVGVGPQKCLLIKRSPDATPEFFYDSIQGFEHQAGTSYVIDVAITEVENPPADASSLQYRLVEIVQETTATLSEQIDGTSWTLLGFRNGDLFDPVPENVEITIAFADGRVNGSAGCNNYMGSFTADGGELSFGPLAATKKLCAPDVQQFEDRYLPLISQVEAGEWTFDDRLVLTGPDPMSLVFAPAG